MLDHTESHLPNSLPASPASPSSQSASPFVAGAYRRVLIVTQFYPPDYAATGQLIAELAVHLSRMGLNVRIFTGQPGYAFDREFAPKREANQQVEVQRSRASRAWPLRVRGRAINGLLFCMRTAMHLIRVARHRDVMVVTSEPPYLPVLGYLANRLLRLRYICLLYDLYPDVAVALKMVSSRHWLVRLWNWLNMQIWQQADQIIVLSSSMRDRVLAKAPHLKAKISVIPSWADPQLIVPMDKTHNWFAQHYDCVNTFTVQYSGNLGRCHDLDTILRAAELLRDEPIQFLFIGRGAQLRACVERVARSQLTRCRFLPYQDKEILPYSLTACDLSLVSISPGLEGLVAPSKLYGILAAGRPVAAICESHSYLRKILHEAHCGQAFESGDAAGLAHYIRTLSQSPKLVKTLGQSGRDYLDQHYTPSKIAQAYWQVLTQD
ncbi:glycosyltransferase family 4 protein [Spirulina major]|uniref:glycosyltransferase family 4 protein n=1 Tax=Spirulina major TaxID=270636 RepID=UPI000933ADDB|nr:glycosyltransferase family 4 protein [Spirulina major]